MSNDTAIKNVANEVRTILIPKGLNDNSLIFTKLKEKFGIDVLYTDSTSSDGYLRWNKETKMPQIILSRYDGTGRYKNRHLFTIAHELGHLFLHWKWVPGVDLTDKAHKNILDVSKPMYRKKNGVFENNIKEHDANKFSAELLMPEKQVRYIYNHLDDKDKDFNIAKTFIAKEFDVSDSAAYVRLKNIFGEQQ